MPRPRLPRTQWADDSLRTETRQSSLAEEPSNQEVFAACLAEFNEVRLRVTVACYGPGSVHKPKPKYLFLLGESCTVHCRGLDEVQWFREELQKWIASLDGVRLERQDEPAAAEGADDAQL